MLQGGLVAEVSLRGKYAVALRWRSRRHVTPASFGIAKGPLLVSSFRPIIRYCCSEILVRRDVLKIAKCARRRRWSRYRVISISATHEDMLRDRYRAEASTRCFWLCSFLPA